MAQDETCRLLGTCDAGIQMAIRSIDDVLPLVESSHLRQQLTNCRRAHEHLRTETHALLGRFEGEGKSPGPMASGMRWLRTNVRLAVQPGDQSVADLIIDGCNTGIKALHRSCNRCPGASDEALRLAGRLIEEERKLQRDLQSYL